MIISRPIPKNDSLALFLSHQHISSLHPLNPARRFFPLQPTSPFAKLSHQPFYTQIIQGRPDQIFHFIHLLLSLSSSFYSFHDSPSLPNIVSSPTAHVSYFIFSHPLSFLPHFTSYNISHSTWVTPFAGYLLTFYLVRYTLLHPPIWRRTMALRRQCR